MCDIEKRVLGKKINIARVDPLGFVEVRLALVPLASPPRDIGERFRNLAAIGQELTRLLKVMHRGGVILQTGVLITSLGQYGLAEIGLHSESSFGCRSFRFAEGRRGLK